MSEPVDFWRERALVPPSACATCGEAFRDIEPDCWTCGARRGAPNVIAASSQAEQDALLDRVIAVIETARASNAEQRCLELALASQETHAVVNLSLIQANFFFQSDRQLYANYSGLVGGGVRKPAETNFDQRRRAVDAALFGVYADEIHFAALTLDHKGLASYGAVALELKDVAIESRASVLDENSFTFVERHGLGPRSLPGGHRAPWETRHLLVVSKLGSRLTRLTSPADFPALLMGGSGARESDDFFEVHIYGGFDYHAVARVGVELGGDVDPVHLRMLRERLLKLDIPLEEHG